MATLLSRKPTGRANRFCSALFRILKSGRVYSGVLVNGLSSIGNFATSMAVARMAGISEFGQFAVAFAIYALIVGVVRAGVVEPLLAAGPRLPDLRRAARQASFLAAIAAVFAVIGAIAASSPYLLIIGVTINGLCIFDYSKMMNLVSFERRRAVWQESVWLLCSFLGAALTIMGAIPAVFGFAIWSCSGALIGYVAVIAQRIQFAPVWVRTRIATRDALAFAADYLVGSGSAQVGFNVVSLIAGLPVVGALRAASTLLGPIGIVANTARTLAIPYLARRGRHRDSAVAAAIAGTVVVGAFSVPLLTAVTLLPDAIGVLVLGENWRYAQAVIFWLALEMLFSVIATMPFAGFRALMAGRASLSIRSVLALFRITVVAIAAAFGDVAVVGASFAAVAGVGSVVWWIGYVICLRNREQRS